MTVISGPRINKGNTMYAKSKLVYTVQEMNENKTIEDIEVEET